MKLSHSSVAGRIAACLCGHSECNLLLAQAHPKMIQHLTSNLRPDKLEHAITWNVAFSWAPYSRTKIVRLALWDTVHSCTLLSWFVSLWLQLCKIFCWYFVSVTQSIHQMALDSAHWVSVYKRQAGCSESLVLANKAIDNYTVCMQIYNWQEVAKENILPGQVQRKLEADWKWGLLPHAQNTVRWLLLSIMHQDSLCSCASQDIGIA